MIMLIRKQKVEPIAVWGKAASQLEAWSVFYTVFLVDDIGNPAAYEMFIINKEKFGFSPQMRAQPRQHPTIPAAFVCLIKQDFNKRLWKALKRWQSFR